MSFSTPAEIRACLAGDVAPSGKAPLDLPTRLFRVVCFARSKLLFASRGS